MLFSRNNGANDDPTGFRLLASSCPAQPRSRARAGSGPCRARVAHRRGSRGAGVAEGFVRCIGTETTPDPFERLEREARGRSQAREARGALADVRVAPPPPAWRRGCRTGSRPPRSCCRLSTRPLPPQARACRSPAAPRPTEVRPRSPRHTARSRRRARAASRGRERRCCDRPRQRSTSGFLVLAPTLTHLDWFCLADHARRKDPADRPPEVRPLLGGWVGGGEELAESRLRSGRNARTSRMGMAKRRARRIGADRKSVGNREEVERATRCV